ncbi:unnamed protein product [Mytilus edulis]|uniref:C1q domain-containing protein n=1 Tax=Mytilus edulis TaxID=6550 RepID=A0A8S3RSK9_MYTED|nr:unnamed protein product [Mytilus edulis]
MESRMLIVLMFLVFSCSVLACDTSEEIRKIHEILKQQQLEILKLQNENKSFKAENNLLTKNVDRLNEIISRLDHSSEDKAVLQKRVEDPQQSTHVKDSTLEYNRAIPASEPVIVAFSAYMSNRDDGHTYFDVLVNDSVYGKMFGDTDDVCCDYDSDTGTLVLSLNQGDTVVIRSSRQATTQIPSSDVWGARTTFAGWKLN